MILISESERGYELEKYIDHLQQIRAGLPKGAKSFALAPWHYDMEHRKCPHDSWLQSVTLKELSRGRRKELRRLEIVATFLASFHDGVFDIIYKDVRSYSLVLPDKEKERRATIVHGDWIIDEILLTQDGLVSHEILFSESGVWKIACGDIVHRWRDTPNPGN